MVTYDQAVYFLEGILKMPPNWRDLLQDKPLEFLTLYLKRHATRVPFQNMHMAAVPEGHRWFPSHEQLIENGLSGRGGCCLPLNYFTRLLFQAIGLDSFSVRGDHYCAPVAGTHCMTIVRLHAPKEKGLYMVEVGGAFPMMEPVPMDSHKLPFRTLQAAGFPYEFREIAPGWIGKFHIGGGIMGGAFTDKKETLRTYWDLKPRDLWEFDYPMLETYTKPCYSALLRGPFMYRFFTNTEFQKLFPELPENANVAVKEKVYVTKQKSIPKIGKVAGGLVPFKNEKPTEIVSNGKSSEKISNGKSSEKVSNGKPAPTSIASTPSTPAKTPTTENGKAATTPVLEKTISVGKAGLEQIISKLQLDESDEDFEVVTEEELVESDGDDDDDLEDPKNFIFAYKLRLVVADAKSRKVIRDYKSYEEMGADLKKYFPKIPTKVVDKAIKTFSAYVPEPSPYDKIL